MPTDEEQQIYHQVHAARVSKRRADKDLVQVEIPRLYRDWFKQYAALDGTTIGVAINAALEVFMDQEEGVKLG
jgi:hypothetical protein